MLRRRFILATLTALACDSPLDDIDIEKRPDLNNLCSAMGLRSCRRSGIPEDENRLLAKFNIACERERVAEACAIIGTLHAEGRLLPKDGSRATYFRMIACDLGLKRACGKAEALGRIGEGRDGEDRMLEAALARAGGSDEEKCRGGDAEACNEAGRKLDRDSIHRTSLAHALSLYERACALRHPAGCDNAGWMHQQSRGTTRNHARALAFYAKACELGNANGCNNEGVLRAKGLGVTADDKAAARLYHKACAGNNAFGCSNVGHFYREGRGLPKDEVLARGYFVMACKLGNTDACGEVKDKARPSRPARRDSRAKRRR